MADFTQYGGPSKEWQDHVAAYGPAPETPVHTMTAEQIQKATNAGREASSAQAMKDEGLAEKVQIETTHIPSRDGYAIPTRIYSPKNTSAAKLPIFIYFHGGGFIYGTPNTDDAGLSHIVAGMPIIIISAIYRHAPQDVYPAAHNDADDAFDWVILNAGSIGGDLDKVVVGGLSAGGNLAASVVLNKHKQGAKIKGLLLGIPYLILNTEKFPADYHVDETKASRVQCKDAPMLPMEVVDFFSNTFKGKDGGELPDVGLTSEEDLKGFPSTTFLVAGNDPLRDDGFMFAEKLQRAGVPVDFHIFPGVPHAFRMFNDLKSSKRWDQVTRESIQWALADQKPQTGPIAVKLEGTMDWTETSIIYSSN